MVSNKGLQNPNITNYIFIDNLKNVYENFISKWKEIILLIDTSNLFVFLYLHIKYGALKQK